MKSKTTIEVNGKRYDAVTGTVLGVASAPPVRTGHNIDGFFRSRTTTTKTVPVADKIAVLAPVAPTPKPHPQPQRTVNHAKAHAPQHAARNIGIHETPARHHNQTPTVHRTPSTINYAKHRTAQSSTTLMRKTVQRPTPSFHKQAGTTGTLQHTVPSLIVPKQSAISVNADRLLRAQETARSPQISHHGEHHAVQPSVIPLAVQPVPEKPEEKVPSTTPAPVPTNNPNDLFNKALANANHFVDIHTHRKHFKKQVQHHIISMAAGTLALVVIAGFAAYQNTPGLQFKVASIQAGVSTHMPNFQAAGFAYNGVRSGDSKLTVGFSDKRGDYQLTQQTTNLSASDVIQNISATDASGTPNYRTLTTDGTTIYRFSNTDATWVSNGTWYTVTGNGALSDSQVTSLVKNI